MFLANRHRWNRYIYLEFRSWESPCAKYSFSSASGLEENLFSYGVMEEQKKRTNPNPNSWKKEEEFEFCKVCHLNHDQGRRHNFFPNHVNSLSSLLSLFLKKLSDVRFFLKNTHLLRPEHAYRNRIWCVFCDSDIEEIDSLFACNNAITHLASLEHLKNLKHFLWKYGGGMDQIDSFRVSEEDLSKWEKRCKSLKSSAGSSIERSYERTKDIQNELNSDNMDNLDKNTIISFESSLSNGVPPLHYFTNERYQVSCPDITGVAHVGHLLHDASSLPAGMQGNMRFQGMHVTERTAMDLTDGPVCKDSQRFLIGNSREGSVGWSPSNGGMFQGYQLERMVNGDSSNQVLRNFTQVSQLLPEEPKGNVHSGAPPPWFEKNEENQQNLQVNTGLCINGLVSPLDKSGKSRRLNPKRVGAAWAEKRKMEMEMEKRGEFVSNDSNPNWLPNFGRVWQSGSRKESRKEFEMGKEKSLKVDDLSETTVKIQPYISKRMQRDADESKAPADGHLDGIRNFLNLHNDKTL